MNWTIYKYDPNFPKSLAIKPSDDLAELQSFGVTEAR
jgi:hypothetical protein